MTKMDDGDHSLGMTREEGRPQTCPVTDWETVKAQERFDRMYRQEVMGDMVLGEDDIPGLLHVQRLGKNATPRSKRSRYHHRHDYVYARDLISSDDDSQVPSLEFVSFSSTKRLSGKSSTARTATTFDQDATAGFGRLGNDQFPIPASYSARTGDEDGSQGSGENHGSREYSLCSDDPDAQDIDNLQNDLDLLSDEEGMEDWGEAVATAERSNRELIGGIYELLDQSQPGENGSSLPGENRSIPPGENDGSLEAHPEDELMAEGRSGENGGDQSAALDCAMTASVQAIEDYKIQKEAARCCLALMQSERLDSQKHAREKIPDVHTPCVGPIPPGVITAEETSEQDGEPFEDLYLGYKDGFTSSTLQQTAMGSTGPRVQSRGATPCSRLVASPERTTSRSAGRAPSRAKTDDITGRCAQQLMTTRVHAPPSIPSVHAALGVRSPRKGMYDPSLDVHARKEMMPVNYLKQVRQLRSEPVLSTERSRDDDDDDDDMSYSAGHLLQMSLRVIHLNINRQAPTRVVSSPQIMYPVPAVTPACSTDDQMKENGFGENRYLNDNVRSIAPSNLNNLSGWVDISSIGNTPEFGYPIPGYSCTEGPEQYTERIQSTRTEKPAGDVQRLLQRRVSTSDIYQSVDKRTHGQREDNRIAAVRKQSEYRHHLARIQSIYSREDRKDVDEWKQHYNTLRERQQLERRQTRQSIDRQNAINKSRTIQNLAVIGSSVDVTQVTDAAFTCFDRGILHESATVIQRHFRGYYTRKSFELLKQKSLLYTQSWPEFVNQYKSMMHRIQRRLGIENTRVGFSLSAANNYMNDRYRYERMFDETCRGDVMSLSELPAYLTELRLHPSTSDLQNTVNAVFTGSPSLSRGLCKAEVMEVTFQMYPPRGTGLSRVHPPPSTSGQTL